MLPNRGSKSITDVEIAVAEYVDWSTPQAPRRDRTDPAADFETNHWASQSAEIYAAIDPVAVGNK